MQLYSQPAEVFEKCLLHYKGLCYRVLGNFDAAIALYEDILLNDPTYIDSCYAVIDVGHTYLESNGRAVGELSHLQPISLESHQETTRILLESIRKGNDLQTQVPQVAKSVLNQNYPNPFNPITTISFSIPDECNVDLIIYNIKGQKVKALVNNNLLEGNYSVVWNGFDESGKSVSSGVYFYKLSVNDKSQSVKKCLLLK